MIGSTSLSLDKKFDMKKAFDSVPYRPLLEKLASIGLHCNILQWVRSYLTDRQQCVVLLGGEASNDIPVLSGVPQGSVLGPLFFLLCIDDITRVYISPIKLNLYTDGILLYNEGHVHV